MSKPSSPAVESENPQPSDHGCVTGRPEAKVGMSYVSLITLAISTLHPVHNYGALRVKGEGGVYLCDFTRGLYLSSNFVPYFFC